jgi:ATP-dependent helicase/nuclease subunit A
LTVWWDPAILTLDVEELAPLRHQRLLEADPEGVAAAASEQQYAAWKANQAALRASASQPTLSVETATTLSRKKAAVADESAGGHKTRVEMPIDVETLPRGDTERPGGRRFGALVHALLGSINLDASADAIQEAASVHGRLVAATDDEIRAATTTVAIVLAHPIIRRAAASAGNGGLRRETPIILRLEDGALVEGVVDLAFKEAAGWTVVDFKTDREFKESSDRHLRQVQVYVNAVAAATDSPARGMLLVI